MVVLEQSMWAAVDDIVEVVCGMLHSRCACELGLIAPVELLFHVLIVDFVLVLHGCFGRVH